MDGGPVWYGVAQCTPGVLARWCAYLTSRARQVHHSGNVA